MPKEDRWNTNNEQSSTQSSLQGIFFVFCNYVPITEPQNNRIVRVLSDLWRSHVHLQQVTQALNQVGFGCLQGGRFHDVPGQPVPLLCHPQCKTDFPPLEMELFCVLFNDHCSLSFHWQHWKEFGTTLLISDFKIFVYIDGIPPQYSLL